MFICGIDSAPTRTGLCFASFMLDTRAYLTNVVKRKDKGDLELVDYIDKIMHFLVAFESTGAISLFVLEDYTRQTNSMVSFDAGEVGGILRYQILKGWEGRGNTPLLIVHPSTLRSFVADGRPLPKGRSKNYLTAYCQEDFKLGTAGLNAKDASDVADACSLANFGKMYMQINAKNIVLHEWSDKRLALANKARLIRGELGGHN